MEKATESLRSFSLDILSQIHAVTGKTTPVTKQELKEIGCKLPTTSVDLRVLIGPSEDGLENLEVMLHVIGPFGDQLPAACQNSCQEAWAVFDGFVAKYAFDYDTAERTTRVLRHGVTLFGHSTLRVAASVLSRMVSSFEATGFSAFLWIAGKIVGRFGHESDSALRTAFQALFERSTNKVVSLLQSKAPRDIPDGKATSSMCCSSLNLVNQFWRTTSNCLRSYRTWPPTSFSSPTLSHWLSELPWQLSPSFIPISSLHL